MTEPRRPRLQLKIAAQRAYCGRCGEFVGEMVPGGNVFLIRKRGHGWVRVVDWPVEREHGVTEWRLKRRRHVNPAVGGPSTAAGAEAWAGDVVWCPNERCNGRQVVPSG